MRQWGLERKVIPELYAPLAQEEQPWLALAARTEGDPISFANTLSGAVRAVDSEQPVFDIHSGEQVISDQLGWRTFNTSLLLVFGMLALALASIGIYGVISHSVLQRIRRSGFASRWARSTESRRAMPSLTPRLQVF